ncbi:hypothetical protein BGZ57DRAFT_933916 [Hyaloscypha finlandica]|nr:hypothetical protein BGZ57DRAFT_933916 [Hyaloscypha finlandica]
MEVDKIFSLLGLCREMNNAQTFGVVEDYSLSVQEAYTRTALFILEGGQNLDLLAALRFQSYNENISRLPSWVPTGAIPNIPPYLSTQDPVVIQWPNIPSLSAVSRMPRKGYLHTHILYLFGHLIDWITEVGHGYNTEMAQASAWLCFKNIFNFAGSHLLETLVNWWTQFGGNLFVLQESLATIKYGQGTKYNTDSIMELIRRFEQRGFHDLPIVLKRVWTFIPIRASELYSRYTVSGIQEDDFYGNGLAHMEGRSMARTENSRLALVPDGARIGDHTASCKGGRVPLVLRNAASRGRYQIVGEGYVHRVMDVKEDYDEDTCMKLAMV